MPGAANRCTKYAGMPLTANALPESNSNDALIFRKEIKVRTRIF